ncbi:MAG: hypothetical protein ACI9E1_000216 [Cryomorphaceae bacterium]|jgi:hypothetical protein
MIKTVLTSLIVNLCCTGAVLAEEKPCIDMNAWKQFVGKPGTSGWRVNVIQPDPENHGPDGFNHHDWDDDGLKDLIVGAKAWYKQPDENKHDPANWKRYEIGKANWPMSNIINDIDGDGDDDILVQERKQQGIFYLENPGKEKLTQPWPLQVIDVEKNGMFMTLGDVNGDGRPDLVKASGRGIVQLYLRTNNKGKPIYNKVEVPRQCNRTASQQRVNPRALPSSR